MEHPYTLIKRILILANGFVANGYRFLSIRPFADSQIRPFPCVLTIRYGLEFDSKIRDWLLHRILPLLEYGFQFIDSLGLSLQVAFKVFDGLGGLCRLFCQ